MNKNKEVAEQRIDKEIARRAHGGHMQTYHITGISRKINGITFVSLSKYDYKKLLIFVTDIAYYLDAKTGDAFPSDIKKSLVEYQGSIPDIKASIGFAICDHRDQYNHQEGRIKAKRSWLGMNPRR